MLARTEKVRELERFAKDHLAKNVDFKYAPDEAFVEDVDRVMAEIVDHTDIGRIDCLIVNPNLGPNGVTQLSRMAEDHIDLNIGTEAREMDLSKVCIPSGVLGMKALCVPVSNPPTHTMTLFDDKVEALIRHEMGHAFFFRHMKEYTNLPKVPLLGSPDRGEWKALYGVTDRAKDDILEAFAENFVLYSIGREDEIHPALREIFDRHCSWGWSGKDRELVN